MTLTQIQAQAMYETNNDSADVTDYSDLLAYINEGYDLLVMAYAKVHPVAGSTTYPTLSSSSDVPATPAWSHLALAHYAAWCIYRRGNPVRQNRGVPFLNAFTQIKNQLRSEGTTGVIPTNFTNVPDAHTYGDGDETFVFPYN